MLKIAVTGGRDFNNKDFIVKTLSKFLGQEVILAHGGCRGVDTICAEFACQHGWPVITYLPNWKEYGNAAGHIRNEEMLTNFKPQLLIAFPGGTGTFDCSKRAESKGILVIYANNKGEQNEEG